VKVIANNPAAMRSSEGNQRGAVSHGRIDVVDDDRVSVSKRSADLLSLTQLPVPGAPHQIFAHMMMCGREPHLKKGAFARCWKTHEAHQTTLIAFALYHHVPSKEATVRSCGRQRAMPKVLRQTWRISKLLKPSRGGLRLR